MKNPILPIQQLLQTQLMRPLHYSVISALGLFSAGCAYSPIIVEPVSKAPLIELHQSERYEAIVPSPASPDKSVSYEQSEKRHVRVRANRIRNAQAEMQQLALEIELLTLENQRIRQKTAYRQKFQAGKRRIKLQLAQQRQAEVALPVYQPSAEYRAATEAVLEKKDEIDRALTQVAQYSASADMSPATLLSHAQSVAPAFNPSPQVVTATAGALYHTVYVFPKKVTWQTMWHSLETRSVSDKWKGFNRSKGVFFIYVGAYGNRVIAHRRREDLHHRIGVAPLVLKGNKRQTLASLLDSIRG